MDDSRFVELARRLSGGRPRRPLLGVGLMALAALDTGLAWSSEADAKKKGKGGNTTQPPTTKLPVTCPSGERPCHGGCIPRKDCCSSLGEFRDRDGADSNSVRPQPSKQMDRR